MLEQLKILFELIIQLILTILNPVVLIPVLIIVGIRYYKIKKYKEETYYKITKVSYFNVLSDTGKYGEYLTYKYLKEFENRGATFLFNIYVPKKEEETTEIDVLMISQKGLFVFESKNYSGWIFGNDSQRYWYQTLPSGRSSHKEKFYNPVFQNNTHVKYLKSLLGNQIPVYSIIIFSDRCTLKNITIHNSKVIVINRFNVYKVVASIYNDNIDNSLTDAEVEKIYNKLYPYTQVSVDIKQKHIDDIHNNINKDNKLIEKVIAPVEEVLTIEDGKKFNNNEIETENSLSSEKVQETSQDNNIIENSKNDNTEVEDVLICPDCGSTLILRKARYGQYAGNEFYGCSNYPKCKYIRNK